MGQVQISSAMIMLSDWGPVNANKNQATSSERTFSSGYLLVADFVEKVPVCRQIIASASCLAGADLVEVPSSFQMMGFAG